MGKEGLAGARRPASKVESPPLSPPLSSLSLLWEQATAPCSLTAPCLVHAPLDEMSPSPPFRGAVDINPADTDNISAAEAWMFTMMEEHWIKPCHARVGDALIGLCMFGPAFAVAACILIPTLLLSLRQQRAVEAARRAKKKN